MPGCDAIVCPQMQCRVVIVSCNFPLIVMILCARQIHYLYCCICSSYLCGHIMMLLHPKCPTVMPLCALHPPTPCAYMTSRRGLNALLWCNNLWPSRCHVCFPGSFVVLANTNCFLLNRWVYGHFLQNYPGVSWITHSAACAHATDCLNCYCPKYSPPPPLRPSVTSHTHTHTHTPHDAKPGHMTPQLRNPFYI